MKKILLLFFTISLSSNSYSQNEANIWCFGVDAGLDFNSGSPVSFSGVVMNQLEGCASISDAGGSLLFYTDGITVMNKNHLQMPNGSGLLGNYSSTQSAIILKQPGSSTLYYIITTGAGASGLNYSVVDITLQGGLGDVTIKNAPLIPDCDERVTAARHANGSDIWIVTTTNLTDSVKAFLFTSTGITTSPVVSFTGTNHTGGSDNIGYLKASIQADHLAVAVHTGSFELYDFDNATGLISNPVVMASPNYDLAYGVEFSPDGTRLYGSEYGVGDNVYQFDLTAGSPAAIINSATLVGASTTSGYAAALQLGPDQKIYLALEFDTRLGVINDPNQLGMACNYVDMGVTLTSGTCQGGLPNYYPALLVTGPPIALFTSPNHICPGTCTNFTNISQNGVSYLWMFPGANPSQSTDINPTSICYNSPGQYTVTLIATNQNGSDTLTLQNYITVYPQPSPQSIMQSGDTLFALAGASSYQWYYNGNIIPGATDYFYVALSTGDYNVVATDNNGCEVEAVINDVIADIDQLVVGNMQLAIFPNPVTESLTVNRSTLIGTADVEISVYNILGEKIITNLPEASGQGPIEIDCQFFTEGLYYLEIISGEKSYRAKFVKSTYR